jgi:hypothetical protein
VFLPVACAGLERCHHCQVGRNVLGRLDTHPGSVCPREIVAGRR